MTVRCVIASSTSGGTAATDAASTPGTSASAATTAWIAFAVTDTSAPAASSTHGYQADRCRASATTATVATTMIPSTISGHAHACPASIPERRARSARAVKESQNAPAAMNTVPATAATATRPPRDRTGAGACGFMRAPALQDAARAADHRPVPRWMVRVGRGWRGRRSGSS